MRTLLRPLVPALALLLAGTAASAEPRQTALGANGEIYRLLTGTYGQFFGAGLIPSTNPVLVLEIVRPGDRHPDRMLVPGTESEDVEHASSVSFEERSGAAVVLWASQKNYIRSRINLAVLDGETWSAPIELSGDVWSQKSSPALAVSRDTYLTRTETGTAAHERRIYNVVWWEQSGAGDRVVYSPVVFVDGTYLGWNPVFVLTDLTDGDPSFGAPLLVRDELLRVPTIASGERPSDSVAAFVHPATKQLISVQISSLAGEMTILADQVRADLTSFGQANPTADLAALGERARHQIVDFGVRLGMHPGLLNFVGGRVASGLAQNPAETSLAALGEKARHQIVDFGVRMMAQGLTGAEDRTSAWLAEFGSEQYPATDDGQPLHALRIRLIAARPAPRTEAGTTSVFLSENGEDALIAWQVNDMVRYCEESNGEWSEIRQLQLNADLSLAHAFELLSARVRKN